ncbi:MAG: hypothetical protein ACI85O_001065 [Saprospiraceae bacterium]|jgi:hypothetical protein
MNLKQNSWMYLFFASVLLWLGTVAFSCEVKPEVSAEVGEETTAVPCNITKNDFRLPDSTALKRINQYKAYADTTFTAPSNPKLNDLINPDVRYFQLPRCELDKMLQEVGPGADVKAHLAIKDANVNGVSVQEIVLVFGDSLGTTMNWYDFVDPCPNHCPK